MPRDDVPFLRVKLEGADISQQVSRVDVEDVDRGADKATFVMDDQGSLNSDGLQEGMSVRIEMGWETENVLAFLGRVRSVRSVASNGSRQRVRVTCLDLSSRFMQQAPELERQHVGPLNEILTAIAERNDRRVDPTF